MVRDFPFHSSELQMFPVVTILDQPHTPQHQALQRVVGDTFLYAHPSIRSLIHRYVVIVIYYADHGDQWKNDGWFLIYKRASVTVVTKECIVMVR